MASLTVTNVGRRSGIDTPQIYVSLPGPAGFVPRLAAFTRVRWNRAKAAVSPCRSIPVCSPATMSLEDCFTLQPPTTYSTRERRLVRPSFARLCVSRRLTRDSDRNLASGWVGHGSQVSTQGYMLGHVPRGYGRQPRSQGNDLCCRASASFPTYKDRTSGRIDPVPLLSSPRHLQVPYRWR